MRRERPKRTVDLKTGAPFIWNATVRVDGVLTVACITPTRAFYLHPSRVPADLLRTLNTESE